MTSSPSVTPRKTAPIQKATLDIDDDDEPSLEAESAKPKSKISDFLKKPKPEDKAKAAPPKAAPPKAPTPKAVPPKPKPKPPAPAPVAPVAPVASKPTGLPLFEPGCVDWVPTGLAHHKDKVCLLPVVLDASAAIDGARAPAWLVTAPSKDSPFGGGHVWLVLEKVEDNSDGPGGVVATLALDHLERVVAALKVVDGSLGVCRMDSAYAEMLWSLKATFPNLDWEMCNGNDVKEALERAKDHVDVHVLALRPAPQQVVDDVGDLFDGNDKVTDKKALGRLLQEWQQTGSTWEPPEGKWPCHPVPQHDPRSDKLSSRSELATACDRLLKAPTTGARLEVSKMVASGLAKLNKVQKVEKPEKPSPKLSSVDDDDDEEAETRALLKSPKPKAKLAPKKKKPKSVDPASFVHGARSALCSDDDSMSEGDPGSDEGVPSDEEEGMGSMLASDDDVEQGDDVADKKAKAWRQKEREKNRKRRHSTSGSDDESGESDESDESDDEDEDEGESGGASESEEEMSDSGSDSGKVDSSGDSSEGPNVKASGSASDCSDLDDEKPVVMSRHKHKKRRVLDDDDDDDDDMDMDKPIALIMQQQSTSATTKGKPGAKMVSQGHPLHGAADKKQLALPPKPKDSKAAPPPTAAAAAAAAAPPAASKRPPPATTKREALAQKAQQALSKVEKIVSTHTTPDTVLGKSPGIRAALDTIRVGAVASTQRFIDDNSTEHYNTVIDRLVGVVDQLAEAILSAGKMSNKAQSDAQIDLGLMGSQMLMDMIPQIDALQKFMADASQQVGAISGTASGFGARLAKSVATLRVTEMRR